MLGSDDGDDAFGQQSTVVFKHDHSVNAALVKKKKKADNGDGPEGSSTGDGDDAKGHCGPTRPTRWQSGFLSKRRIGGF